MSIEELQKMLDEMIYKGTVQAYSEAYKEKRYKNSGFTAGGVIDLQVSRLTKGMVDDFHAYMAEQFADVEAGTDTLSQLRTVPVAQSIPLRVELNHEDIAVSVKAGVEGFRCGGKIGGVGPPGHVCIAGLVHFCSQCDKVSYISLYSQVKAGYFTFGFEHPFSGYLLQSV